MRPLLFLRVKYETFAAGSFTFDGLPVISFNSESIEFLPAVDSV